MIKGDIIFPKNIPNLNHSLFKGVRILEFKIPKMRKTKEIINDHILISALLNKGYKAMIKKNTKKTIPKLLFDPVLILLLFKSN